MVLSGLHRFVAAATIALFSFPALSLEYSVEVIEPLDNWPLYRIRFHQNDRGDFAIVYPIDSGRSAKTVVQITGRRLVLTGFMATYLDAAGNMCGMLERGVGQYVGVTWSLSGGFEQLQGAPTAFPYVIGADGTVGGATLYGGQPCIWRDGVLQLLNGVEGRVVVLHDSGMIAGHLPDGGHGDYPWVGWENRPAYLGLNFGIRKAFKNGNLLGNYSTSYSGRALIYDLTLRHTSELPGGNQSHIWDMNESGIGVGALGFGFAWQTTVPNIWERTGSGQYLTHDPAKLVEPGWSDVWLQSVNTSGVILGRGRFNNGPASAILLRPKE